MAVDRGHRESVERGLGRALDDPPRDACRGTGRTGMDEAGYAHVGQGYRSRILDFVNSALSTVPIERRRRLAATLGLFAVLFVTVGIVATTGSTPGVVRV